MLRYMLVRKFGRLVYRGPLMSTPVPIMNVRLTLASNLINRSFRFRSRPVIRTLRNGCCIEDCVL
jgi:hypothetical protein